MRIRDLDGLSAGAIGFGAMVLSPGMYGDIDDDRGEAAVRTAIEVGCTLVDTSDAYGPGGHNEELIGRAIRGRRDEVQIATKFGMLPHDGFTPHRFPVRYAFGELAVNGEPGHVRVALHDSLRRLGTDHVDVYYPHFPDPDVPFEDTIGAISERVAAGEVRHLGVSNVTAEQLRIAHAVHPVSVVQVQWSMWSPIDPELLAAARDLGVGIAAWSPLGGGFLARETGALSDGDFRRNIPRYSDENLAANSERFAPVRRLAAQSGVTEGQLALAWLLHQDPHVVPLPGSRTAGHIRENAAAADIDLDEALLAELHDLLDGIEPAGEMTVL